MLKQRIITAAILLPIALIGFFLLEGLAFAIFHAVILLGDKYINFTLAQLFIPFSTADYRPFWVGIGQLGFYIWLIVALSFSSSSSKRFSVCSPAMP